MTLYSKPRSRKRWLVVVIAVPLIAYLIWRVVYTPPQHGMDPTAAVPASVAEVISRNLTQWRDFSGRLEAVDRAEVRSRVTGTIDKIYFKDGAFVKKGAPLFLIDPRPYQAAVAQAEGQLASAEAEAATARIEADRATKLMRANAIARTIFDERSARAKTAAGAVRTAKGALDAARLNLHYTLITSPISGKASRAEITVGNLVNSEPVLTTIVTQSPLYVSFEADEQTYLSFIRNNAGRDFPVEMGLSNETETPHKGKIDSFDNQLDPQAGTIRVRAIFDNSDGQLVPGLYARVRVGAPDMQTSVLVNEKAINTDQSSKYVLAIDKDGKAAYTPVTLGGSEGGMRVVTSGLKPGDKIVVNGLSRLRPGSKIQEIPASMETLEPLNPPAAPAAAEAK